MGFNRQMRRPMLRRAASGIAVGIGLFLSLQSLAVPVLPTEELHLPAPVSSLPREAREALMQATRALVDSRFKQAEALARGILEQQPESGDAWQVLGYALANQEQYDEAIAALDEAAEHYTRNASPLATQGEIYLHLNQHEQARQAFERALEMEPDNTRALERLGAMAIGDGEIERAIGYFEAAANELEPLEIGIKPTLADLYFQTGQPEKVERLLGPWASLPEGIPGRVLALLGRAAAEQGDDSAALRYFEARLRRDPTLDAFVDLGTFYRNNLDFTAAERVFKEAAGQFPESGVPWNELGRTYGSEGSYEAALGAFERGLNIAPDTVSLMRGARLSQFRLGRLDAAHAFAARLASRQDAQASDYVWLGSIEQARGNVDAALEAYQAAVQADSTNWVALNNLAVLLTQQKPDRAVEHARAALELSDHAPSVRDTLGWALFKSGDMAAARQVFAELKADAPEDATVAYRHGRVLLSMGKSAEGRAEIQRALDLDSAFSYAEDARARLAD